MKRSIARKWAKALESGEYKQCTGKMRKGDKFCALGVLCNLHAQEHPQIAAKEKVKSRYLGEDVELPMAVVEWAGMNSATGYINWAYTIVDMNDTEERPFEYIAAVIRKAWKKL
jgi:hypothetical protein